MRRNIPFEIILTEKVQSHRLSQDLHIVVRENALGTSGYASKELKLVQRIIEGYTKNFLKLQPNHNKDKWCHYICNILKEDILPPVEGFELDNIWTGGKRPNEKAAIWLHTRQGVPVKGRKNIYYVDFTDKTVSVHGAVLATRLIDTVCSIRFPVMPYEWDADEMIVPFNEIEECTECFEDMESVESDIYSRKWRKADGTVIYSIPNKGRVVPANMGYQYPFSKKLQLIKIRAGWKSYGKHVDATAIVSFLYEDDNPGFHAEPDTMSDRDKQYGADAVFSISDRNMPDDAIGVLVEVSLDSGCFDDINTMWVSISSECADAAEDSVLNYEICCIEADIGEGDRGKCNIAVCKILLDGNSIQVTNLSACYW